METEHNYVDVIARSGLFDRAFYLKQIKRSSTHPIIHYLRIGANAGRNPHPLFDTKWYLTMNPDVAAAGVNPLLHFLRYGAAEGRAPHPLFDTAWYLRTNPDVLASGVNPLVHYLARGPLERRSPHPLFDAQPGLANQDIGARGEAAASAPDLSELRALERRGRIAIVVHVFYPDLWDEMRQAIGKVDELFDLFVSLTIGVSDQMRAPVKRAYPDAYIFEHPNIGRDIAPFLALLRSGALFKYELVCKLHTKRGQRQREANVQIPVGDAWRRRLIDGILGSPGHVRRIIDAFRKDQDLGMVVADGNIFRGHQYWDGNERILAKLLPRIAISPDVRALGFAAGSIFWIRPFVLRSLLGAKLELQDFEPEPLAADGCLPHAVERVFSLICAEAGMKVAELSRLEAAEDRRSQPASKVDVVAFYLPQFHPIPENDGWWGAGFTEWTNVARAKPAFPGHRQPRLPADLGFYDLRLAEVREQQAGFARAYGVSAFCYYYYWFNGRRILERPLNEVQRTGKPGFPFMICWANEPWTRNWDGLSRDVLLAQTYDPGWIESFADDVAPLLLDRRYFRLDGRPMLLIYRIGHIPDAREAARALRAALGERGVAEAHIAAAWTHFQDDGVLPANPEDLGLDAYFEFPPHRLRSYACVGAEAGADFRGRMYDYNRTVGAALSDLEEPVLGRRHRAVMLGWDNTARMGLRSHIFHGATPANFRRWLRGAVAHERRQKGDRVVFVNAWNEWAEGAYLEPDSDFGLGWLEAVASAVRAG